MMAADTRVRTSSNQPVTNPEFHKALSTEIKSGFVFEENGVRIEAFEVEHGEIRPAFGYKITTPDKTMRFGKYLRKHAIQFLNLGCFCVRSCNPNSQRGYS